jgi:hypothetical protein
VHMKTISSKSRLSCAASRTDFSAHLPPCRNARVFARAFFVNY